ncbi:MAG: trehalase family glycosidase [Alphaproteobacteria bacterium]|nr:trehalase family glycosidase [Alphaproteobacteria bacterium]
MTVLYTMSAELRKYISASWGFLMRSPFAPAPDPKIHDGKISLLYIPACEDKANIEFHVEERLQTLAASGIAQDSSIPVIVKYLPEDWASIPANQHGLLYLPNPYIVPGGRFNEMYGWDSYWIIRGLIDAKRADLAKGMVENIFYQIKNYGGKVLNANRTYYLRRSQPPLLGLSIKEVAATMAPDERKVFLETAVSYLETDTQFWVQNRYVEETGLYRYGHPNLGALGFCPEVTMGEIDPDSGLNHYDRIIADLKLRDASDPVRARFYDVERDSLTFEAVAGDRSVRESGFDLSSYMGYLGLETLDFNPVCLNTLLVIEMRQLAAFYHELGHEIMTVYWAEKADVLAARIQHYMWNEEAGMYFSFNHRTGKQSTFVFLTTFYPLLAGIATREQAQKVRNNLPLFETEFGLMSAPEQTGCQWDSPNMWAPLVDFTIQGLLAYGYKDDANRIGVKFLKTVDTIFTREGAVYEKYNARFGSSGMAAVTVGYVTNVVGFGWTNALAVCINNMIQPQNLPATVPSAHLPTLE